jgi:O-methyltransferase involved in polyketide biosynthesis
LDKSGDSGTGRISPTAYATGYFWYKQGMSHPALATAQGRRLHYAFRPFIAGTRIFGGLSMDALLLARHRGIDGVLSRAIEEGRIGQVVEVAAGLSPRGWDFMRRYERRLTFLETDLPAMAATKRQLLEGAGLLSARHRVVELDVLAADGPRSLEAVMDTLDPKVGTAIVTEGLMNYFAPEVAQDVWRRFARALARFPQGIYLSDLYLNNRNNGAVVGAFGKLMQAFVRGRMHTHFNCEAQANQRLRDCGFGEVIVHQARGIPAVRDIAHISGADRVSVLEARA